MRYARRAFTLVELLVVIGIIALLISILLPILKQARASAEAVKCQSNQRQLMLAFLTFANEHKQHLPGNYVDWKYKSDPNFMSEEWKSSWLLNRYEPWDTAPQGGTIWKYVKNAGVYLCPSQRDTVIYNVNVGSNGRYDYAAFGVFTGAKLNKIPRLSRFEDDKGKSTMVPTPIICDEEPYHGINGGNVEGLHNATDRITVVHKGGGYYATLDGSVHWFREPPGTSARNWYTRAPSGKEVTLGTSGFGIEWGWFNNQ
jgi:prepilin-type N-terminal cleavage/methylation domain-containing protein